MLYDFLFGIIGILALTVYCLPGAFMVPQIAYWFMTPYATKILEEYGIERKMRGEGCCQNRTPDPDSRSIVYHDDLLCRDTGCRFRDEYMAAWASFSDLLLDGIDLRCRGA